MFRPSTHVFLSTESRATDMEYGQYYGFSRMPFGEDADREIFFKTETHREALAVTLHGIRERKGFIVIFGEQGMGKSTVIRQVMNQLNEQTQVALISKTYDQYYTLLKELMEKLGLRTAKEVTKGSMLHDLYEYLIQCLSKDQNVVIILDDAHRIKDEIIEELRLMSNLETSRTKLIQIVIVGEPELSRRLNSKHLRQIRQRIQILHQLLPLGQDEVLQYIGHRLAWAGRSSDVFTVEALAAICRYAGGIPQNINTLCDRTLTLGAERSEKPVSAGTVGDARKAAAALIQADPSAPAVSQAAKSVLSSPWLYAALAVAVVAVFAGLYFLSPPSGIAPGNAVVQRSLSQKVSPADDAAGTQSAKGAQPPGLPAGKQDAQPASPAAPVPGSVALEPTDAKAPAKEITVTEGATLSSIATRHYGIVNATVLDRIQESNPEITDVDLIRAGSQILLPQAPGKARLVARPNGSFGIHVATFMTYREAQDYSGKIGSNLGGVEIVKRRVAPQKDWYRILVGPFSSREDARRAFQSLERLAPQ
jgi:general secretion pathway protein A